MALNAKDEAGGSAISFSDWQFMEEGARALVDELEKLSRTSLAAERTAFKGDDRERLERGSEQLRRAFNELADKVFAPLSAAGPTRIKYGYEILRQLVEGAFLIGAYGVVTDSALAFRERLGAAHARKAKEKNAADRTAKLETVIRSVVHERNRKLSASDECAREIRPYVRVKLGMVKEGKGYPSEKTIKATISAMKNRSVS